MNKISHQKQARFPDFFIVGAPRCGTTSLSRYLTRNPQICFSRPKEPHYFARIDDTPNTDELNRDYLDRCFAHCKPQHRSLGEGSVSYIYSREAIERILHFNPDARFIVQIRNPLTMLPSYHLRMRYLLQEDQSDFVHAWRLQSARLRGEQIPKRCFDVRVLLYKEIASYGAQLDQLFKLAGRDKTHVIAQDDLIKDPLGVYKTTLEFLGVGYDGQTVFERRFASKLYRYLWLQQLLFAPVTKGGKVVDILQRRARKYNEDGSKRKSLLKRLASLNNVPTSPDPLTAEMTDILRESLQPDVLHLSRLLDRDFSFWLEP